MEERIARLERMVAVLVRYSVGLSCWKDQTKQPQPDCDCHQCQLARDVADILGPEERVTLTGADKGLLRFSDGTEQACEYVTEVQNGLVKVSHIVNGPSWGGLRKFSRLIPIGTDARTVSDVVTRVRVGVPEYSVGEAEVIPTVG